MEGAHTRVSLLETTLWVQLDSLPFPQIVAEHLLYAGTVLVQKLSYPQAVAL